MIGIRYISDDQPKTQLILNMKDQDTLVGEMLDAMLVHDRQREETISFDDFVAQLQSELKING